LLPRKLIFPLFSNLNHQLHVLYSRPFSLLVFLTIQMLFAISATIDTWFPIWLSIYRRHLETWSVRFDWNQRLL